MSSEQQPPIVRDLNDGTPCVVKLDWEGGEVRWVTVDPNWLELVGPAGLIGQVRRAYQEASPPQADWRLSLRLSDVALEDLKEFATLIAEARAAEPIRNREPVVVRSGSLESHWSPPGSLLRIADPHQWLHTAMRQPVCEALTGVLQRPEGLGQEPTREARRLMAFAGRRDEL